MDCLRLNRVLLLLGLACWASANPCPPAGCTEPPPHHVEPLRARRHVLENWESLRPPREASPLADAMSGRPRRDVPTIPGFPRASRDVPGTAEFLRPVRQISETSLRSRRDILESMQHAWSDVVGAVKETGEKIANVFQPTTSRIDGFLDTIKQTG